MIKYFWVQRYGVLLIPPNFWDKQHGNVTDGQKNDGRQQIFPSSLFTFHLKFVPLRTEAANLLTLGQSCEHVGTHLIAALPTV